jgi:16S rRNA (cytosine1402-N4)-methyltransferase
LAFIIYTYGEERLSRRIAAAIVKARSLKKIATTLELAEIIKSVVPFSPKDKLHPATRTFQALRIKVNEELQELEQILEDSLDLLAPNGRLVVVTFHSLEDRIVKNFMNKICKDEAQPSRHAPLIAHQQKAKEFSLLTRKPVFPSDEEIKKNPRSRSAKLRAMIKRKEDL